MAYTGLVASLEQLAAQKRSPDFAANAYGGTGSRGGDASMFAPNKDASMVASQGNNPLYANTGRYDMASGKVTPTPSTAFGTDYPTGAAAFFGAKKQSRSSSPSTYDANKRYTGGYSGGNTMPYGGAGNLGNLSYTAPTMPMPVMGELPAMGALPEYKTPEMGALPEYKAPEMDRARISELAELGMGAPMGRLKQGLNAALIESRYSTNPNIRNLSRKSALAGYGSGIADIRAGAQREGMAGYMPEFQAAQAKAGAEYGAGVGQTMSQYQAGVSQAGREYAAGAGQVGAEYAAGVGQVSSKYQADMNAYLQSLARINAQRQQVPLPGGSYGTPTQFQQPGLQQYPTFNYPTVMPRYGA